jgi:L-ascorbate metabolism protein UlaG (beta-lactamase superfamily)
MRDPGREEPQRSRSEELEALHRAYRGSRRRSMLATWLGGWLRAAPRASAAPLPAVTAGELAVTFAGHASVLLRYARLAVACDPMLGRRVGLAPRAVQPGLSVGELGDVDLILITHDEPDVLHLPTLRRMPRAATIVVPPRCAGQVSNLGFARVVELGQGTSISHRGVEISATPVRRSSGRGACAYVLRGDGPSVFFCGGSGYFSGFAEVGKRYRPDIAILPIGGYVPSSFRHEHMSPADAIFAFEDLNARQLVPIRWGAFSLSYEELDEPIRWLRRLVEERELQAYVTILSAGASTKFQSST